VDAGLRPRDIIVKLDNKPVKTIADVKKLYEQIIGDKKRDKKVALEIRRSGLSRWIVLDYQKDYEEE